MTSRRRIHFEWRGIACTPHCFSRIRIESLHHLILSLPRKDVDTIAYQNRRGITESNIDAPAVERRAGVGDAEADDVARAHLGGRGTGDLAGTRVEGEVEVLVVERGDARPGELAARITSLADENKRLARELQQARMKAAMGGGGTASADEAVEIKGVKLIAREVSGLDKDGLRALVDRHRDAIKSGVVVLACPSDGKVSVVVGVTPDLTKKVPAGQIVKQIAPIVGGGGGGRPDFAEAGGKDPSKIAEMLAASRGVIEKMLLTK